jgi:adenylate cyclase
MLRLVAEAGARSLDVPPGRVLVVGRAEDCDLPLADSTVSRRHAELEAAGAAGLRVRDLGSSNGTFLDGQRVDEGLARPGCRICFGRVAFELQEAAAPAAAGPPSASPPDATILGQIRVRPSTGDVAGLLAEAGDAPAGASLLRISGVSAAQRQERKLALLVELGKELSRQLEIDRLLDQVVDLSFKVMRVDRVAILLADAAGNLVPRRFRTRAGGPGGDVRVRGEEGPRHQATWDPAMLREESPEPAPPSPIPHPPIPRSIVQKVVEERLALRIDNAPADERFAAAGSILAQRVQSALCAPLLGGMGTVLGLIYLDNQGSVASFSEEDLAFLTAFSSIAAVAIENSQLIARTRREALVLANFQRYFAPDLARQIATAEGEIRLGGDRREVVVLFSDIRGFTPLSEQMSPDEIAALLTEYFSAMVEIVFAHGGTLDKFIGDAVMALWGAPLARPDDAQQATRAAIAMQLRLDALNAEWERQGRRTLAIGVGLNTGDVFAGNIGSDRRLEYTVLGDAVNIASRLCSQAGPREVLLSEALYRKLAAPPPVRELAALPLKGKSQPVRVYSVEL